MKSTSTLSLVLSLGVLAQAQTVNLRGKVTNSGGQAIQGVIVTLVGQNLKDTTDASGSYAILQTASGVSQGPQRERIAFNRGVLEMNLATAAPVKIEIFDLSANLILEKSFAEVPAGGFHWNMGEPSVASNLLIVRATIGDRVSTFQYSPLLGGRATLKSANEQSTLGDVSARSAATSAAGSLQFQATGYVTKLVDVASLDATVDASLAMTDRWGGLNNPPIKSSGCGKALGLISKSGTYHISSAGGRGDYIIDIPANYNKDQAYRLVFGNHCLGASATKVATADIGDDLSGFYSMKTLMAKDNIPGIYVAMQGNGDGTWSAPNDLTFWSDVLKQVESNLCVDTTRVFVVGFSFGAMFSYALSLEYPERIRAVATYAPANWNFYQPTNRHIPVAYYQTTGTNDGTCKWVNNDATKQGGKYCLLQHVQDNGCTGDPKIATGSTHVTTTFTGCKDGYPVKFGSFVGGHQATHTDAGTSGNWIEKETWEFLKQF